MSDSAFVAQPAVTGHRRTRSPIDAATLRLVRRAVVLPLVLLAVLVGVAAALAPVPGVGLGYLVAGVVCGLAGVAAVAAREVRVTTRAVQRKVEEVRAGALAAVAGTAAAVEKSVRWSAEELCRGGRPSLPDAQDPPSAGPNAEIDQAFSALQVQAIASLIRVHDESQSVVLLDMLRRLAMREHALVGKSLAAMSELEMLTDDPELLSKIFEVDHLVTRMRRQVESIAVLGGQSLRNARRPVPVAIVMRGAVSEVVQYPRVVVAAGSVGTELGLPGHVGPDLTHLLAELIENACECSDPATNVTVRAQRVANGLAIEVEDRAIPMHPQMRAQMNRLLKSPAEVDVSRQVRSGQLGLLVAAKIAQAHGLSVLLQENMTGGTTALVVIPSRLLVPIAPADEASPPPEPARPAVPTPRQINMASASGTPTGQLTGPNTAAAPAEGASGPSAPVPNLPRRTHQAGAFRRPPQEREQAPATAARPGLAGSFRRGIQAGGNPSPTPDASDRTGH